MAGNPPYDLQALIDSVFPDGAPGATSRPRLCCAEASGSELYVGCSNGELLRFSLRTQGTDMVGSYSLQSRQTVPPGKSMDQLVLVPSISRALVLCERNIFIYTLPALDLIQNSPVRNVVTFAVDEQHLRRKQPNRETVTQHIEPVDLCVLKRSSMTLYHMKEKLIFQKEIPLPSRPILARRTGHHLCVADQEHYNMIDLEAASLFPILPVSQAPDAAPVKPFILVIGDNEFLLLSWTGTSTLGLFVNGDGEPVRGTLEWQMHPKAVAFDDPHVMALMPDDSIEIHNIETQAVVQNIPPPPHHRNLPDSVVLDRVALLASLSGFSVPSAQRAAKLRAVPVKLLRAARLPVRETSRVGKDESDDDVIDPI